MLTARLAPYFQAMTFFITSCRHSRRLGLLCMLAGGCVLYARNDFLLDVEGYSWMLALALAQVCVPLLLIHVLFFLRPC